MRLPALTLGLLLALGCHRNVEPYDPNEKTEEPDLSRIFPEGAERAEEGAPVMPAAAPAAAAAPSSDAEPLRGTIRLADEFESRVPPGAVLFLIARTGPGGPPTAVKRIPDPSFPLEFVLGPDDRMIQAMPFAGPFKLTVRIDADGNAMTRNPGDLQGEAEGSYQPGAEEIELLIDEIL
ncbi:MAG: hypothetical protein JRG95_18640 [Deltaproteobacteria bacterium]|nr:hypothetical protein [Deltaproteobacteria bacterium]